MPERKLKFKHVAIEGAIGVGKSTLARLLAQRTDSKLIEEEVNNPFLRDFYQGKKGSAFQCQLYFLLTRYQQQLPLVQPTLFESSVICDYILEKELIFAQLTLDEKELYLHRKIFQFLLGPLPGPEAIVYLQASTEVLKKRIRKRSRENEKNISEEYIEKLNESYNHFFFHYKRTPLLIVNVNDTDFEKNPEEMDRLVAMINSLEYGVVLYNPPAS
ncbi:MAG TPA: deoxynucleoside kinase [Acidobacteriota bacterium]|jgi:deoxyadenosine/deoxycytidine kinase|nr:deoxynucleoside kinase [Acidobacteriota bacterium]HNT16559.1 deoxynucleoside kinase [Acidobacteriota bacterium]